MILKSFGSNRGELRKLKKLYFLLSFLFQPESNFKFDVGILKK